MPMVKPSKRAKRRSFGSAPKCPIDTGLAKLGTPHDFRDGRTISPQGFHLLNHGECQYRLGSKPNASRLGLIDSILLALAANIVLELGNQRQDAHDKLAGARACIDRGIVEHLELNAPLRQFRDNAIKVGGRTGQVVELCDHQRVAFPSRKYSRQALSAGRPASTPERFSLNTLSQPESFSNCTVRSWPRLLTLAYPTVVIASAPLRQLEKLI